MRKLKAKDVKHVAKLANLNVDKSEVNKYQKQLSEVLDYVEELNEVDTASVEPTSQTTGLTNKTRKDVIDKKNTLSQKDVLSQASSKHKGYFVVPMVLEERTDY